MENSHTYSWLQYAPQPQARPLEIKVESSTLDAQAFTLLSPPSSPSYPRSVPSENATFPSSIVGRKRSSTSTSTSSPKRVKPYPILTRDNRHRAEDNTMAHQPYGTWSPSGIKGTSTRAHFPVEPTSPNRRSSDGDQQPPSSYPVPNTFAAHSYSGRPTDRMDPRPQSSGSSMTTSSLTGAMGETHLSSNSGSASPTEDTSYNMQGVAWTSNQQPNSTSTHTHYTGAPEQGSSMPYHSLSSTTSSSAASYVQYQGYNQPTFHNPSPESLSPRSPSFSTSSSYPDQQFAYQPARTQPSIQNRTTTVHSDYSAPISLPQHSPPQIRPRTSRSTQDAYEDEIRHLRKKVRELELINESARLRQKDLEMELANEIPVPSHGYSHDQTGLPSPILTPSPQSASFHASWKARTDARIRQFCSLNRAGNALCAWHDSRRERRAYPPRMAPPGHLNCGCTYDEALFEESLSRHGVGSYHPGESVRMDPALRNPLLKLLQARYGYRDGDFERDITTGHWVEGEGHALWEHKAIAGMPNTRKIIRGDERR